MTVPARSVRGFSLERRKLKCANGKSGSPSSEADRRFLPGKPPSARSSAVLGSWPNTSSAARIMAALSLYKIGNERGIFAIKQAIQFDADEQVKKMCSILYQMYSVEKEKNK